MSAELLRVGDAAFEEIDWRSLDDDAIDGRYPDELVDEIVDLWEVMHTAPRDNLDIEDGKMTVEQVREGEKGFFAKGGERWLVVARHHASGALVGWTEVTWFPHEPATVWQFGTGVRPEHRGHALGKWMKATMFERIVAERPQVSDIRTHNADSNARDARDQQADGV